MKATLVVAISSALYTVSAQAGGFELSGPELKAHQPIRAEQYANVFGCKGQGLSPTLEWKNAPAGTRSFALTYYDQDAPTGSGFWHWVVYDIPAQVMRLEGGRVAAGAIEGNTDLGKPGYLGACPPVGRKHRYVYTLHALRTEKLDIPSGATAAYAGFVIHGNTLATATLPVTAGPRE